HCCRGLYIQEVGRGTRRGNGSRDRTVGRRNGAGGTVLCGRRQGQSADQEAGAHPPPEQLTKIHVGSPLGGFLAGMTPSLRFPPPDRYHRYRPTVTPESQSVRYPTLPLSFSDPSSRRHQHNLSFRRLVDTAAPAIPQVGG